MASSALRPNPAITRDTLSTELATFWLLIRENLRKSLDRVSSSSPVRPNLVLTSPTAAPTSPHSTGIEVAMSVAMPCIDSSASPVAPVRIATSSRAASTDWKPATLAAAAAMIGAVTVAVSVLPTLPRDSDSEESIEVPMACPASSPAGSAAAPSSEEMVCCAPCILGTMVTYAFASSIFPSAIIYLAISS